MNSHLGQEYWQAMQLMGDYAKANHEAIHGSFLQATGLGSLQVIWNRHNFAWADGGDAYLHRKGATPAERGQIGIIPGTSGSMSYVVSGLGNPKSYESASHGAGRPHSRKKAKELHDEAFVAAHMEEYDIKTVGLNRDETVMAYKDIERVMAAQDGILVDRIAEMFPVAVLMSGSDKKKRG
jgi:tRNA-splicing ligase RtcB